MDYNSSIPIFLSHCCDSKLKIKIFIVVKLCTNPTDSHISMRPLSLSDEANFRVLENRVLRTISESIKNSESGESRIRDSFEIHETYDHPNIIETVELYRLRWPGTC